MVLRTTDGEVMAKILVRRSVRTVELASLNPDHPDLVFPVERIDWMARIVWAEPITPSRIGMKVLSLLFSLLLGAAVLLFFLQPWDRIEKMLGDSVTRETAPPEFTAAVEAAPPKPAETAAPRPMAAVAPNTPPATAPADSRTHMLANEKAEAERSAALQEKAATPAPRETKRYFKVKVLDAGTLKPDLQPRRW